MRLPILAAIIGGLLIPAQAQHNHHQGHDVYRDWTSQRAPTSCCSNQDCGSLNESEHRETDTGTEILIDGQWCPVQRQHFLTRGKSPDGEKAHACVRPKNPFDSHTSPCVRLLCYVGRAGI